MPSTPTVSVCGAGIMGRGIANNLLKNGFAVRCFNRTPGRLSGLLAAGATVWSTPMKAATGADAIVCAVSNDEATEEIWFGPHGVVRGAKAGALAIETSTLSTLFVESWAQRIQKAGLRPVACPVTGSRKGADAGSLVGFVGADVDTLASATPVLSAFCACWHRFDTPVQAMTFKLIYNAIGGGIAAIFAEGLALAAHTDLDPVTVLTALQNVGWGASVAASKGLMMRDARYDEVSFSVAHMLKDLDYALALCEQLGMRPPYLSLSRQAYSDAASYGHRNEDFAAVIEVFRRMNTPRE